MRSFTFLRLTPEMLVPPYEATWARFVQRMRASGAGPPAPPVGKPSPNPDPGSAPGLARRGSRASQGLGVGDSQALQAEAMRSYRCAFTRYIVQM